MKDKNKVTAIVLGVFALVMVTTGATFAFFNYSRTSTSMTTITTGDLEFSYIEGASATLPNAYPVSDNIGANDTNGEYDFRVSMNSSSQNLNINYDVSLISNNKGTSVFKNNQIKFALIKNGVFVADTSEAKGVKLSTISGFDPDETNGEGEVLLDQSITAGQTDFYKLRIWISDDVKYTNTELTNDGIDVNNDQNTSNGKYNSYTYSLKVKVSGQLSTTAYKNLNITKDGNVTVDLEDAFGLQAYAVKSTNEMPNDSEWINIDSSTAKSESKVRKVANTIITSKQVNFKADYAGAYFLFVKNLSNKASRKTIAVTGLKVAIFLEAMGGEIENDNVEIDSEGFYTNLPQPTKPGYVFTGWYTKQNGGDIANDLTSYNSLKAKTLYAHYENGTYTLTINPNNGTYDNSTGEKTEQVTYLDTYQLKVPTRVGYTFNGWQINGDGTIINDNTLTMGVENTEIIAKWNINKYALTIDLNDGSTNQTYDMNYNSTKNINEPTRDGYTFTGWEITGTNATLNGETFTIGESNATLKASWQANDYKYITKHYKQNIIDDYYTLVNADTEENNATFGTSVTPVVKTYTGFIAPVVKTLTITSDVNNNLVEYNYVREKRTLTVNPNGGLYNSVSENTEYTLKYEETKTIENPTRIGYDFNGWNKENGELNDNVFKMVLDNSSLTAKWVAKKYTITFNAGDGVVSETSKEVTFDGTYGTLPEPTREKHDFEGWYLDENFENEVRSTSIVNITENKVLYAKWQCTDASCMPYVRGDVKTVSEALDDLREKLK